MLFGSIQNIVVFVIGVGAFAFEVWALVDALRYPAGAYTAAGKQSKALWGGLLGGATVVGFLGLPQPLGFSYTSALSLLGLAAIAAAAIYFARVRPTLRGIGRTPRKARNKRGGW